jgi:hypothetical protein
LTRFRTFILLCLLALAVPIVIAGCGSDDSSSDEDPQAVLEETFNNDTKVSSGDLSLTASVDAEGEQGGSFEASLSGPFQGDPDNENAIPQLDWTASVSGSGAGQSIDFTGGLVVTSDNAYVEYNDQAYEVGTDAFSQLKQAFEAQAQAAGGGSTDQGTFQEQCATAIEQAGGDPSACDIDLESWLTNLTNEGTEDVGGTESIHISGDANIEQILTDIGELASSVPSAASSGFDPSQLSAVSGAVTDASINVYSGESDHVLRKFEVNLGIDPSAVAPEGVTVPIGEITVDFAVEIGGLNEDQTIDAPSGAKPISELLSDLGVDPSALGEIPGLSGGAGGAGGAGGDYLECVQQATTPDEINDCASQL